MDGFFMLLNEREVLASCCYCDDDDDEYSICVEFSYLIFFKKNLIEIYSYFEENFHFFKIENRFKKKNPKPHDL